MINRRLNDRASCIAQRRPRRTETPEEEGGNFLRLLLETANIRVPCVIDFATSSDGSVTWHYTPKHGSWLNLAESELSVLSGQCLDERIPNKQTLVDEIAAWQTSRNKAHVKANWRFTTREARVKLHRLYPAV